jgi:hypothetical protein
LSETRFILTRPKTVDYNSLFESFKSNRCGENKSAFTTRLNDVLVQPDQCELQLVSGTKGQPLSLIGYDTTKKGELRIPCLRVCSGPQSQTLARHLLFMVIKRAVENDCSLVRVTDAFMQTDLLAALQDAFVRKSESEWIKVCPKGFGDRKALSTVLKSIAADSGDPLKLVNPFGDFGHAHTTTDAAKIEKRYWPFKLTDSNLPCYIVPIQPKWAKHLVDQRLAKGDLLGADETVAMNCESVYYKTAMNPKTFPVPARILWYVSQNPMELRAASLLIDVDVGPAKELFAKNRKYGVFRRQDVKKVAKGDLDNQIMAIRFAGTEMFSNPISFDKVRALLREAGIKTTFQSPVEIPPETYFQIYRLVSKDSE